MSRVWKTEAEFMNGAYDQARAGRFTLNLHKVNGGYNVVLWENLALLGKWRVHDLPRARVMFTLHERQLMITVATELFDANA